MTSSPFLCDNCGAANQSQSAYCRSCGLPMQAAKPSIYHSSSGQLLPNILLKQRYRIVASLGQGGMGVVYKAEDTQLGNRQVALKEMIQSGLNPQQQQDAAAAFKQEAIMLARLHHPNLPNIFDHFEENGRWYLVMNFIKGETLFDYINHSPGRKLPLDEVVQIGTQLCTVLSYLHNQQPAIIFRDLKLANVMRTPEGHIYLIDFGIARHFKGNQTRDTRIGYTPGYAAPEQYGSSQTSPRSDIYSLGVVLYQLLSGHNPSVTPFQFPPLRSLVPTVPIELATLITQMLEIDENKRPASVQIVGQKLQSVITSPRSIPPTPPLQPIMATSRAPISPKAYPAPAAIHTQLAPMAVKSESRKGVWLFVFLLVVVFVGILLISQENLHSGGAQPTSVASISTQTPVQVTETWSGQFHEADGSTSQVGLSINGGSTAASFSGKWTNYVGVVSIKGYVTSFNSLQINVQKDLNNIGASTSSHIIYWLGEGDATGNIWPDGSYYCVLSGAQMQCLAYAGASTLNFNLSLNGTKSIFIV